MAAPSEVRYSLTLPAGLNETVENLADELHTSKADILRKALILFKHAANAKKVELTTASDEGKEEKQTILIR